MRGKAGVVLLAREALFLRGGDDLAVRDERGGAVVIERRDAEDAHAALEQRVDERRDALPFASTTGRRRAGAR